MLRGVVSAIDYFRLFLPCDVWCLVRCFRRWTSFGMGCGVVVCRPLLVVAGAFGTRLFPRWTRVALHIALFRGVVLPGTVPWEKGSGCVLP